MNFIENILDDARMGPGGLTLKVLNTTIDVLNSVKRSDITGNRFERELGENIVI